VLNFHGYTSNDFEQMWYGDFRPIADTAGFLVVHPMGTVDLVGNTHWNVGWGLSTVDDIGFTSALIDSLAAQYNINQDRIYSTGMSNGGFMSYQLACELSDRIAAIASVTGSFNVNQLTTCHPDHQMPVMEIHGTADPTVPYDGNALFAPIPSVVNFWAISIIVKRLLRSTACLILIPMMAAQPNIKYFRMGRMAQLLSITKSSVVCMHGPALHLEELVLTRIWMLLRRSGVSFPNMIFMG
jgi:hypothetical protein